MAGTKAEVLITNDSSGQMWNSCLWDPHTGSALVTYKGGISAPNTTQIVGDTFLVSSVPSKPILNVWALNRREQRPSKQVTPGPVQALAASPCGKFIVAGIDQKLYLWQGCSGKLLAIVNRHYQDVSHVAFTDDGSHFVSAGRDGNVFVWRLLTAAVSRSLPGQENGDRNAPRYQWSQHALSITGLVIGSGGCRSRVFTTSLDQTCKVFCIATGHLLLDVTFSVPLTSVAVDVTEKTVFVGSDAGPIHVFMLTSPPRDLRMAMEADDKSHMFSGHTKQVVSLSVSMDSLMLASGSMDMDVRLWHIHSRQCVRVLTHKGPVATVRFILPVEGMFNMGTFVPRVALAPFERSVTDPGSDCSLQVLTHDSPPDHDPDPTEDDDSLTARLPNLCSSSALPDADHAELDRLKTINLQLYQFTMNKLLLGSKS